MPALTRRAKGMVMSSSKDYLKCGEAANEAMLKLQSLASCMSSEILIPKLETACPSVMEP